MYWMKWQYVKTDALINCKNATNSEGSVTEESCSNKCCEYCEKSVGLNGLIVMLDSQCSIINGKLSYIAEIIATLKATHAAMEVIKRRCGP